MTVEVEVLGKFPECQRCKKTFENVQKAAELLSERGIEVKVSKVDAAARETIARYGIVIPPAVAVNGFVRVAGRVPSVDEVKMLIMEASG